MTNHTDLVEKVNQSNWSDHSLRLLQVDFDSAMLLIDDPVGKEAVALSCFGYIGFSRYGHWDETIIKTIRITSEADTCKKSILEVKRNYGNSPLPGGGYRRISDGWLELTMEFIDGTTLEIAFLNIKVASCPATPSQ